MTPSPPNPGEDLPPEPSGTVLPAEMAASGASAAEASPEPPRTIAPYVMQLGRSAMACDFDVLLNAGQYLHGPDVAIEALDLVDLLEDQLSVYREQTELMEINRTAVAAAVEVEERLFELLQRAQQWWKETCGALDITAGPLSKAWGFYRRAGKFPTEAEMQAAIVNVGGQHVLLDEPTRTIRFTRPGVEINLNAIGKGYALDRCAELLTSQGVNDFLMHGGQSSVLARGQRADEATPGWSVSLGHPLRREKLLGVIHLTDAAIGTSGSGMQNFTYRGQRYGHIFDPRTGRPADKVLSSTVIAPTAAMADGLSTAFYVLGPKEAAKYCRKHPEVKMILVCPGKSPGEIEVVTRNLKEQEWVRGE